MKHLPFPQSFSAFMLVSTLSLVAGCAGNAHIPDTITEEQGELPAIHGTVFGGHAPLVGAHVYVLQTGSGAIGASSSSLLGNNGGVSPAGYPLQTNVSDPNIPTGGTAWQYVLTDSTGSFNLSNGYKCTANAPVYLYAYGGSPTTSGPTAFNPAVVNLATLGLCPLAGTFKSTITYVYMNEVSTIATAYAFQGFTSALNNDAVHIGYSGLNSASEGLKGIQNAANNTFQMYDIQGSVSGHNANYLSYVPGSGPTTGPNKGLGVVPQTVIDTLANVLAACVDSGNTSSPPTIAACAALFATATADGTSTGTKPTDTATAAINIARHPAGVGNPSFAATIFGLFTPTGAPFSPYLNNAPPDFTIGIQFPSSSSSIFAGPQSVATDANGNIWLTTQPTSATTSGTLAEASPYGIVQHFATNTSNTPGNVAIDSGGNGWAGTLKGYLTNTTELTAAGTAYSYGTSFTRAAVTVADNSTTSGNVYMVHGPTCPIPAGGCSGANNNPTLTVVNSSGGAGASYLLTASFAPGAYITHGQMDAAGYIWLTSDNGGTITRVNKTSGNVPVASFFPITSGGSCGSGIINPEQPAIDRLGNAWVPVYGLGGSSGGTGVYVVTPTGLCNYFDTQYGATDSPYGAAVDGASNVWITNRTGGAGMASGVGSLTGLNYLTGVPLTSTLTTAGPNFQPENQTSSGVVIPLLNDPMNVAVDISGDVIVTNFGGNSIVEIIGLTTPVYGPLGLAAAGSPTLIGATP